MRRLVLAVLIICLLSIEEQEACAQTRLRVGFCSSTINSAAAPFAIAQKMGWYAKDGIQLELMLLSGSTECVKFVARKELSYALPSVEPLAIIRPQGVKARIFYTAYQGFTYGLAVPQNSPIESIAALKGKSIGVFSMGSAGVVVARALAASAGLNPDSDIRIVVAGQGAQTAALLRNGQVDALSQVDTVYAMVENAGIKLRRLASPEIEHFPANGFLALEETLRTARTQAVALAQGYAKGTIFAMTNPQAAVRILWELYPESKPMGKDEATALNDDLKVLEARMQNWRLEKGGVSKWGESSVKNYTAYIDFLQKWGVTREKVPVTDLITNDLIAEINKFDATKVIVAAKAYKSH
jgi:NitT/TauT family transport system substrate-binding protein